MKKFSLIAAFFVLVCSVKAFSQDQIVYTDPAQTKLSPDAPGDDMGLNFTVNDWITVDALGAFNSSGSGTITGYIQVGIYDLTTGEWATPAVTFHGTYPVEGEGYDVFQSIAPVSLAPGNYQIDAVGFDDPTYSPEDMSGNQYYGSTGPIPNGLGGAISFTGASYGFIGVLAPRSSCGGCSPLPAQVSQFDAGTFEAHVPEGGATSLYLLLAGVCCFGAIFASGKQLASRA
jgi:hypothetical protein